MRWLVGLLVMAIYGAANAACYVAGGITVLRHRNPPTYSITTVDYGYADINLQAQRYTHTFTEVDFLPYDRPYVRNPYGDVALGCDKDFTIGIGRFQAEMEAWHRSGMLVGDRGDDGVTGRLKYYFW